MAASTLNPISLQSSVRAAIRVILLIGLGTAALAVAAHIQVPFWPVKLSMQTLVVIMLGVLYGSRLGLATVLAYIAEGAAGLPVFQSGAGFAYLAGPTGGFLIGFALAATFAGWAAERGALSRLSTSFATVLLATTLIFVPGIAWLAVLFGPEKAIAFGLLPFIPGESLKIALALSLTTLIRRYRGR